MVDDDRQPESQLAQPDRGRIHVDAEDRSRQQRAADRDGTAAVVGSERGAPVSSSSSVHEERARAAGRIEDRHIERALAEAWRRRPASIGAPSRAPATWLALMPGIARRLDERSARDARDERVRCVVRATFAAGMRCHQRFERLAEHLGVDRGIGPRRVILARREAVARQEIVEDAPECVVRKMELGGGARSAIVRTARR